MRSCGPGNRVRRIRTIENQLLWREAGLCRFMDNTWQLGMGQGAKMGSVEPIREGYAHQFHCCWEHHSTVLSCDRVSLCGIGWPQTHHIAQASLEFTVILLPISWMLGLWACVITSGFHSLSSDFLLKTPPALSSQTLFVCCLDFLQEMERFLIL